MEAEMHAVNSSRYLVSLYWHHRGAEDPSKTLNRAETRASLNIVEIRAHRSSSINQSKPDAMRPECPPVVTDLIRASPLITHIVELHSLAAAARDETLSSPRNTIYTLSCGSGHSILLTLYAIRHVCSPDRESSSDIPSILVSYSL